MQRTRTEELIHYVDLTLQIRELSSPQVRDNQTAEDYRQTLLRNFHHIGVLAGENNSILERCWFPLLEKNDKLTAEEKEDLEAFGDLLMDSLSMENLDLPMIYRQSHCLLRYAEAHGTDKELILALDRMVDAAFVMMHITQRLEPVSPVMYGYRDEGIACAERVIAYLAPERFARLADDLTKKKVLVLSRYICTLFERGDSVGDETVNEHDLDVMKRTLSLVDDPFYRKQAPAYDWLNHEFRALQYVTSLVERDNCHKFNREQLSFINDCAKRLENIWNKHYDALSPNWTQELLDLNVLRAAYHAAEVDSAFYQTSLMDILRHCKEDDYSFRSAKVQLLIPLEYLGSLDSGNLSEENIYCLNMLYQRLINYVHHMPKSGALSFSLTLVTEIIESFVDVPGGMDFETFCLSLIASIHPPTYVHSLTVSQISVCLARHLLEKEPARFIGMFGCRTEEDVREKSSFILDFTEHAALCHDFGKIFVSEIIISYGRKLLDEEFQMIRLHPEIGAHILSSHLSTAPYANVALLHHRYFNDGGGYPEKAGKQGLRENVIIDIVTCADCMDAATDVIGRSYKFGKSLQEFLLELDADAGTLYAPYLAELMKDETVFADVQDILSEGRNDNYRKAYHILSAYDE